MYGEYTCPFIHYSGKICGRCCMHEFGCSIHWKYVRKLVDKPLIPCKEFGCKQRTRSDSGKCPDRKRVLRLQTLLEVAL